MALSIALSSPDGVGPSEMPLGPELVAGSDSQGNAQEMNW